MDEDHRLRQLPDPLSSTSTKALVDVVHPTAAARAATTETLGSVTEVAALAAADQRPRRPSAGAGHQRPGPSLASCTVMTLSAPMLAQSIL